MAYQGYGGYVWSDEPPPPSHDWRAQGLSLGVAAGLGVTGMYAATRQRPDGSRAIDDIARVANISGGLSPFQLLNTFRLPERLSPFTSHKYQGLGQVPGSGLWSTSWDAASFDTVESFQYLKRLTNKSNDELASLGIFRGGKSLDQASKAEKIVFERQRDAVKGKLYSYVGGEKKLLAEDIMLQQFKTQAPYAAGVEGVLGGKQNVNKIALSYLQAMDMWDGEDAWKTGKNVDPELAVNKLFSKKVPKLDDKGRFVKNEFVRPDFIPVPGSAKAFVGSSLAASMYRFSSLSRGLLDSTIGREGTQALSSLMGFDLNTKPGNAARMFTSFGTKAAMVGGVGLAIGELDWMRRNFGIPGQAFASGAVSLGAAQAMKRMRFSSRAQMFGAVASFAGQMILPGFDQGLLPGIASSYAGATKARALPVNPFNYYRRTVEGYLPGATDWKTGALLATGVIGLSYTGRAVAGGRAFSQVILDRIGPGGSGKLDFEKVHRSYRDNIYSELFKNEGSTVFKSNAFSRLQSRYQTNQRFGSLSDLYDLTTTLGKEFLGSGNRSRMLGYLSDVVSRAEMRTFEQLDLNEASETLYESLHRTALKYNAKNEMFGLRRQAEGFGKKFIYSFFGADLARPELAENVSKLGFKFNMGRVGTLAAGTMLLHGLVSGGLLGSMEGYTELDEIYSGKKLVEVGKSRWWEAGGTSFEGSETDYYRPHWYALMMNRVREKGIWGEDEDRYSPIAKAFLKNFTYELERKNYYDRPYPLTSAAFEGVPIIGGMLSSTVGQFIKPARMMHAGEWIRSGPNGGAQYASVFEGSSREPAYAVGAQGPGIPASPYNLMNQFYHLNYQFRELSGMTGWAANVMSDIIVGTDTYGGGPQMAEAGLMTSHRLRFWENSMGGGFFMNEAIRRIFPSYRSDIEKQNPIMNSMPTWLPDKFRYGDPYRVIEWGEALLPGAGYAAMHPELQGTDPEDYPLMYQYDILSNVAPFSYEFRQMRERIYRMRQQGEFTPEHEAFMDRIDVRVAERYNIYDFERVDARAIQLPGSNLTQSAFFAGQEALRSTTAPLEYMIPMGFRPVQKLLANRDPIERYEFERMYGTTNAFWDQPWRDWFRPSMYSLASLMGFEGKPLWRQDADETNAYFDKVEFFKWMQLAEQAAAAGDKKAQSSYEYEASKTRMGVNPNGNPLGIYWSLPDDERSYFNAFALATGRDRKRILEMVPEDQVHLYQTIWRRIDENDPRLYAGSPTDPDRQHMLRQFYAMQSEELPPTDWIGYHEDVDIDDIRVRYVNELGRDLHDYGLWEQELKKSMAQPFLEGSTQPLHAGPAPGTIKGDIHRMLGGGSNTLNIMQTTGIPYASLDYLDYRDEDIDRMLGDYYGE